VLASDLNLIPASPFCAVERLVGPLDNTLGSIAFEKTGDAQGSGGVGHTGLKLELESLDPLSDCLGDPSGVGKGTIGEKNRHFLAPIASTEVTLSQDDLLDRLGAGNQDSVAADVEVRVVDRLEVVEVDHHKGELVGGESGFVQLGFKAVVEAASVVQPGQRVFRHLNPNFIEFLVETPDRLAQGADLAFTRLALARRMSHGCIDEGLKPLGNGAYLHTIGRSTHAIQLAVEPVEEDFVASLHRLEPFAHQAEHRGKFCAL